MCVCAAMLQLDWSENRLSYQYTYLCMRSLAHICSYKRGIAPANELCMGCCLVYTVHYVIQVIYIAPITIERWKSDPECPFSDCGHDHHNHATHTGDNEFELDGEPLGQVERRWGEVWEGLWCEVGR